ncbi:hypothetical protein L1049_015866 [Liquidambar formosana]|uniref:Uncharacterized protein n=1 Tax=Liquidambar formosana TaxID=63359 RepID=A0AAP0RYA8_LIQFO
MSPAIINLQLHLLNKQSVSYHENQNLVNVILWDHVLKTMLTEFFKICSRNRDARAYLYRKFPKYYVWNRDRKFWFERKKSEVIGRVNGVNPIEREHYYLGEGDKVVDEIQQFQDARWVLAQESLWRIYEFNLSKMSLAVINLQLHLLNK